MATQAPATASTKAPAEATTASPHEGGWQAELALDFELRDERTVLARRKHRGPLIVQRPFHPEPDGTCHVIVLHPPGGVAGGDRLSVRARAAAGARALLTSPAAQKLYRGFGRRAALHQRLDAAAGARLEWLPLETIVFDGADVESTLTAELAPDAAFIGWEVTCLGRPAASERFREGRFLQRIELHRQGRPLFRERNEFVGGANVLDEPWGLGGCPVIGLMVCALPELRGRDDLVTELRSLEAAPGFACTQLGEVLVCRYLGHKVEEAQTAFRLSWNRLRSRLWRREAPMPRIWST